MVNEIHELRGEIIGRIKSDIASRGIDRINVQEMGELVDMVKDLAEAEEKCWKAQYYRNLVSDAMENKYGYQTKSDDIIDQLGDKYSKLSHDEKMVMKSKILTKLGSM